MRFNVYLVGQLLRVCRLEQHHTLWKDLLKYLLKEFPGYTTNILAQFIMIIDAQFFPEIGYFFEFLKGILNQVFPMQQNGVSALCNVNQVVWYHNPQVIILFDLQTQAS